MIKPLLTLLAALLLSACQTPVSDPLDGTNDPKDGRWSLEFVAPRYMSGWVETSQVEDIQGHIIDHGLGGIIGKGSSASNLTTEVARGWPRNLGRTYHGVIGADLPKRIFVRWQSVVEQKTYRAWIDIPEKARELMHTSTHRRCVETPDQEANYTAVVHLGLAPGGVVQVWVMNECYREVKVARAQAEIEPLGPHQGKSGGHYYPLGEYSKRYIEKYGIPYGSW